MWGRGPAQRKQSLKKNHYNNNLPSEFDPHRHLRSKASVRQYNGAALVNLQAEQVKQC
jgi:hypothetical protein